MCGYKDIYDYNNRTKGFTLAEILVTLIIIGVVAALTIPSLLQNIQNEQLRTTWRKNYSIISQALINYKETSGRDTIVGAPFLYPDNVTSELKKYFNTTKLCQYTAGCWHDLSYDFSGNSVVSNPATRTSIILADGTLMNLTIINSSCIGTNNWLNDICARLWVDINGFKEPNTIGQDIFGVWLLKDKVLPLGAGNDSYNPATNCQTPNNGWGCSAKYIFQ